jgi:hypothetical protein
MPTYHGQMLLERSWYRTSGAQIILFLQWKGGPEAISTTYNHFNNHSHESFGYLNETFSLFCSNIQANWGFFHKHAASVSFKIPWTHAFLFLFHSTLHNISGSDTKVKYLRLNCDSNDIPIRKVKAHFLSKSYVRDLANDKAHVIFGQIGTPQLRYKGKVKLSLCLTNYALCHEGVWWRGCIAPHILDLGTIWRWVMSFTSQPLYPDTHWTGGWVGPRTGLDDVEKRKFLILPGLELRLPRL